MKNPTVMQSAGSGRESHNPERRKLFGWGCLAAIGITGLVYSSRDALFNGIERFVDNRRNLPDVKTTKSSDIKLPSVKFGEFTCSTRFSVSRNAKTISEDNPYGNEACNSFMQIISDPNKAEELEDGRNVHLFVGFNGFSGTGLRSSLRKNYLNSSSLSKIKGGLEDYPFRDDLYKSMVEIIRSGKLLSTVEKYIGRKIKAPVTENRMPDPDADFVNQTLDDLLKSTQVIPVRRRDILPGTNPMDPRELQKLFIVRVAMELGEHATVEELKVALEQEEN
ncbi:hypothetical protein HOF56_04490 [Candidatus Peribacteria bacterium]|jgi:hypothetical protein|nr:hypothetical protein [Candidatus Peribacteria bacterium]MBT4021250.1 hypothetical protein [Candidatus Peribacteria bacterium]MBT4241112.1 hypothetical protein [Candidatus Peribacteria bacterium]